MNFMLVRCTATLYTEFRPYFNFQLEQLAIISFTIHYFNLKGTGGGGDFHLPP